MATVQHFTSGSGRRTFQANGFLFYRVYIVLHTTCSMFLNILLVRINKLKIRILFESL